MKKNVCMGHEFREAHLFFNGSTTSKISKYGSVSMSPWSSLKLLSHSIPDSDIQILLAFPEAWQFLRCIYMSSAVT